MAKSIKKLASSPEYVSPKQLTFDCFQSPFSQNLDSRNRWVILANLIPWDEICNTYLKRVGISDTGRPPLNPRIVIGSMIIKHICNLDDRETVLQISENMYMQYFIGYTSFTTEAPFDASLFVEFRKRLTLEHLNELNEKIILLKTRFEQNDKSTTNKKDNSDEPPTPSSTNEAEQKSNNKGKLILDATACPQNIAYPTDLNLLSDAREKSEELIDLLYNKEKHIQKPRTYRENARKEYLQTAQKKNKSKKEIRKAVGNQLRYLKRNIQTINNLLDSYDNIPLKPKDHKYLFVINTVYQQQHQMYDLRTHSIEDRIVSIHQPHVRPIVRGKSQAKVEFGAKINVSLIDGISFLDELSWNAFNEGKNLIKYVEYYYKRFGFYPREILVDQIYCTRENRKALKLLNIKLIAKPLGRPSAVSNHVRPGERNPIEGKFGQAKTAYGLNKIKARLKNTSESWIASIILVLNLVKLAGAALPCLIKCYLKLSFSAKYFLKIKTVFKERILEKIFFKFYISYSRKLIWL